MSAHVSCRAGHRLQRKPEASSLGQATSRAICLQVPDREKEPDTRMGTVRIPESPGRIWLLFQTYGSQQGSEGTVPGS